mmetsp:Transcript_6242/g.14292  ORF Transcript_6242/g.14292 Transcript_6242/m.14292 type:complete len:201 (+) Transcript_6242:381-983(+)
MPTLRTITSGSSMPPTRRSTASRGSGPATPAVRTRSGPSPRTGTTSGATSTTQVKRRRGLAPLRSWTPRRSSRCAWSSPSATWILARSRRCPGGSAAVHTPTCVRGDMRRSVNSTPSYSRMTSSFASTATAILACRAARSSQTGLRRLSSTSRRTLTFSTSAGPAGATATTGTGSRPRAPGPRETSTSARPSTFGRPSRT